MRSARVVATLAMSLLLAPSMAACDTKPPSTSSSVPAAASPLPEATLSPPIADLDLLLQSLERLHPNPWHGVARAQFLAALEALKGRLETLTPQQAEVEVMRLVAMISARGRDGHMFAVPTDGHEGPVLPFRVYEFAEGVFITADLRPGTGLAGSRLMAIGGHPIDDVLAALEPLVPRDGPATVPAFRPIFLLRIDVLRGLGLLDDGPVAITVADADGSAPHHVEVAPVGMDRLSAAAGGGNPAALPARAGTLYLQGGEAVFSTQRLSGGAAVYARYRAVRRPAREALEAFISDSADPGVERVILDLRQNVGGDNHTYAALLDALRAPEMDQPGRLFVLTDRLTFSAAANLATRLEVGTGATFAGEPMGGGLNFWDDVTWVTLAHLPIPMRVGISRIYWEMSTPDDPRLTIDPQIELPVRAADYFSDHDPVLAAVLPGETKD